MAIGTVVLVITPISWILLHQPQSDNADASVPYVSRPDDTYITASTDPVSAAATPPAPGSRETVTPTPTTSTPPSTPATPGETPSTGGPTDQQTLVPTRTPGATTRPTDTPSSGSTGTPKPKPSTTTTTTSPPATTPTPPDDDGNMSPDEDRLFALVDSARRDNGCAPLRHNDGLSGTADSKAQTRADADDFSTSGSEAAAGGDGMSADAAYNKLMDESSGTLLNCSLKELGVGSGTAEREEGGVICKLLGRGCTTKTRVGWVADFN